HRDYGEAIIIDSLGLLRVRGWEPRGRLSDPRAGWSSGEKCAKIGFMTRLYWTGITARRWKKASGWEEQPSKTLWGLLELLIVPLILIGALAFWNHSETARENHRADQQRQDTTLGAYFNKMSNLMLHERLLHSGTGEPVRTAARTITFAALRGLDGEWKAEVVRFLYQA